jgi:hypothetical protein
MKVATAVSMDPAAPQRAVSSELNWLPTRTWEGADFEWLDGYHALRHSFIGILVA